MFTRIFRIRESKINKFQKENGGNKKMFGKVFKISIAMVLAFLICQQAGADILFQDNLENYAGGYNIPLDSNQTGILSGQKFNDCKAGGPESGSLKVVDGANGPIYTGIRALQLTDGSGSNCKITARVILQLAQGSFIFEVYARKGSSNGSSVVLLLVKDKDTGHTIIAEKKASLTTNYQLFSLPVAINSAQVGHKMQFEVMNSELGTTLFVDEVKIYTGILPPPVLIPVLTISPNSGLIGSVANITGQNFTAGKTAQISFDTIVVANPIVAGNGTFSANFFVPVVAVGNYAITAKIDGVVIQTANFTVIASVVPPLPVIAPNTIRVTELITARKFKIELLNAEKGATVVAYVGELSVILPEIQLNSGNYEGVFEESGQKKSILAVTIKVSKGNVTTTIQGTDISIDTLPPRFDSLVFEPQKEAYKSGDQFRIIVQAEEGGTVRIEVLDWSLRTTLSASGGEHKTTIYVPQKPDGKYKGTAILTRNIQTPPVRREFEVTVDNTAPTLEVKDYWVESGKLKFIVKSDDLKAVVKFKDGMLFNSDNKGEFIGLMNIISGQKKAEVSIFAEDKAGNKTEKSLSVLITSAEDGTNVNVPSNLTTQTVFLKKGINFFSLIVNIGINKKPYLSQLVEQIGINDVSLVVYFDQDSQRFKSYIYNNGYPDKIIERGEAFIVSMKQAKEVIFIGTPWVDPVAGPNLREWNYAKLVHDLRGQLDQNNFDLIVNWLKELGLFIPERTALLQNYPNPFNPETWIPYQLPEDASVEIAIYDIHGQLVKLFMGQKKAGFYVKKGQAAYWDGRNTFGERVSSGVYYYTLQAGNFTATRKMVIVK